MSKMTQNELSELSEVLQELYIKPESGNSAEFRQWVLKYADKIKEESGNCLKALVLVIIPKSNPVPLFHPCPSPVLVLPHIGPLPKALYMLLLTSLPTLKTSHLVVSLKSQYFQVTKRVTFYMINGNMRWNAYKQMAMLIMLSV